MDISKTRNRSSIATVTDPKILIPAIGGAFRKLDPRVLIHNPVMFVVEIVATLTTILFLRDMATGVGHLGFAFQINLWLWFTVLFANFAEAIAEGRGKAQAASLRQTKTDAMAKLLTSGERQQPKSVCWRPSPETWRYRAGRGGRLGAQRRRCDRRHCLGQRISHHR